MKISEEIIKKNTYKNEIKMNFFNVNYNIQNQCVLTAGICVFFLHKFYVTLNFKSKYKKTYFFVNILRLEKSKFFLENKFLTSKGC